jgi:ADP-ribose pyrophosphatase YjhB (NUDIX family)
MTDATQIHEGLYYDERSAGGIVYKIENNKTFWLVIKTLAKRQTGRVGEKLRKVVFKFPKGHLNSGEVLKKAALREVEEEGKVKSRIVTKVGSNDYIIWDREEKRKIIKKVTFFLMEFESDSNLRYFDNEMVLDREWLTFEEAIKRLSYDSEKILLKKARNRLENVINKLKRN